MNKITIPTYHIENCGKEPFDLPCCPVCDQPIDEMSEPALGIYQDDSGFLSTCLIHEYCGENCKE